MSAEDALREEYVKLTQELARQMSADELQGAIHQLKLQRLALELHWLMNELPAGSLESKKASLAQAVLLAGTQEELDALCPQEVHEAEASE